MGRPVDGLINEWVAGWLVGGWLGGGWVCECMDELVNGWKEG